jgi:hypothetical protein
VDANGIENNRYVMSAISQGLAALFALVFTITLIVIQIAYRYRGVLDEFFKDVFNIFFIVLNGCGIVLPLVFLRTNANELLTDIAIVIASLCVFLLLPFILRMKYFITLNIGTRQALGFAKNAIEQGDIHGCNTNVNDIENSIQLSFNDEDYKFVLFIIRELLELSRYQQN